MRTLSVVRTHDPSFRAGEDSSCLKPRGHCAMLNEVRRYERKLLCVGFSVYLKTIKIELYFQTGHYYCSCIGQTSIL